MEKTTILVVEDEFITGAELQRKLQKMGYDVPEVVDTGRKAIQAATEHRPALILMDITLKEEMTGIQAADIIGRDLGIPVIFLTAHSDDATVEKAVRSLPFGYLIKPVDERALRTTIQMALYKSEMDSKVRERDHTIQELIDANAEPVFILDQETRVLAINSAFSPALDPPDLVPGNRNLDTLVTRGIISPYLADMIRNHFYDKNPFHCEEEFREKWIAYTITPLTNSNGQMDRCAINSTDITGIKRAQRSLRELNRQLEEDKKKLLMYATTMNSMDDFIVCTDDKGMIIFVNDAFMRRFGYTVDEVVDKHFSILKSPEDHIAVDRNAFLNDKKTVWNGNFTGINKYKLKVKTLLKSTPVIHKDNSISRIFVLREQFAD
jgi:PAS domain S-box-containing protein